MKNLRTFSLNIARLNVENPPPQKKNDKKNYNLVFSGAIR